MNKRLALFFLSIIVAGTASAWHPLEPLDTSSPRATMATFLNVTDEVASGPRSAIYDIAENRLHVQKAVMALTM